MLIYDLQPRGTVAPLWNFRSLCTSYKSSTHHLITLSLSALKIRGMYIVPRRYCSNHKNLRQSSMSSSITLTTSTEMDVCMSFIYLRTVNISCATLWCNDVACYFYNILLYSSGYTSRIFSRVGVGDVFVISSGKSAITFLR